MTSSASEARRFDATHRTGDGRAHGHTEQHRRAALTLARGARDRAELRELLEMCGLLETRDDDSQGVAGRDGAPSPL